MEYKKLYIDLPKQPLVNQRPWSIVGILLAVIFLLAIGYAYFNARHKPANASPDIKSVNIKIQALNSAW